jgi:hypothetical protein
MADSAAGRARQPLVCEKMSKLADDAGAWASMEEIHDHYKGEMQEVGCLPSVFDQGTSVEPSSSSQGAAHSLPVSVMRVGNVAPRYLPFEPGRYMVNRRYGGIGERTPRGMYTEVGYLPMTAQTVVTVIQDRKVHLLTNNASIAKTHCWL